MPVQPRASQWSQAFGRGAGRPLAAGGRELLWRVHGGRFLSRFLPPWRWWPVCMAARVEECAVDRSNGMRSEMVGNEEVRRRSLYDLMKERASLGKPLDSKVLRNHSEANLSSGMRLRTRRDVLTKVFGSARTPLGSVCRMALQ